jgi:hypothetical protein
VSEKQSSDETLRKSNAAKGNENFDFEKNAFWKCERNRRLSQD